MENNGFEGKIILVTGGLGSIGEGIVQELIPLKPKQIRILDNRETELFYARQKYKEHDNLRFFYGDVRDKERLFKAMHEVNLVFHAAALKHVFLSEYDPYEAIKTNVHGTQNVIEAAMANNVDKMILISTDKAVNPCNVMGTTKLLAERLISSMHYHRGKNKTQFGAVRFGNVLASRGSVLEIWNKQLAENKKITITDPEMTRFFMSIPESVRLIFYASHLAKDGETFIFKMNSVKIKDMAEAFLELHGRPADFYEVIGKHKGEKMHEELIFAEEQDYLLENDSFFVKLPLIDESSSLFQEFKEKGFLPSTSDNFTSNHPSILLDKAQIKELLKDYIPKKDLT